MIPSKQRGETSGGTLTALRLIINLNQFWVGACKTQPSDNLSTKSLNERGSKLKKINGQIMLMACCCPVSRAVEVLRT